MIRKNKYMEELLIAEKDIETAKNDPLYSETDKLASQLVSNFISKTSGNSMNERFIKENIAGVDTSGHIETKPAVRKVLTRYLAIAAAIAGAALLLRSIFPSSDPDRLYNRFYAPMSLVSEVTRTSTDVTANLNLETAIGYYKKGDYEKAMNSFSNLSPDGIPEGNIFFYKGITSLALTKYNEALTLLDKAANSDSDYIKEAQWYLGLAFLKTGDKEKAAELFRNLSLIPGYYKDSAGLILRRLKK